MQEQTAFPQQFSFWHLGLVGRVAPSRADGRLFHNSKGIQSARDGATRPSALGSVDVQEGESPSLVELNASN